MQEQEISEKESLALISQMILQAKKEQKDDGWSWIVWGWLLFFASFLSYLNLQFKWGANMFLFWNTFGIFSILLLIYSSIKSFTAKEKVKTYSQDIFNKLNIGFFISLMLIIVAMNVQGNIIMGFSLLLGLYGFWILIYATLVNFKPSMIGAFVTWGFALASLFADDFKQVMLLHAAAVLCGYIIPGHIANMEFRKINR